MDADENPAYLEKEKKDKNMDFYRQHKKGYGKEALQPLQDGQFDDINIDLSKYLITREEFINKLDKHDLTVGQDQANQILEILFAGQPDNKISMQ